MKIEIIICTYNRAEKLKGAIQSILDAEVPENTTVRLILVNNNSTDNTKRVIKEFLINKQIETIYLFELKQGKSNALNTALMNITGDLIAFTDDDVTVDKSWIKEMVDTLKKYMGYSCFGGRVVAVYPDNMPAWFDINGSMKFLKSAFVDRDDGDLEVEYGTNTISGAPGGCNMFFRKAVIVKNGFFRTDLGHIGNDLGFSEDTEYCQRLMEKGERFMYIPSSVVYHPVHPGRLSKDYLLMWQYKCGMSEVRRSKGYKNAVRLFGVPRYIYRKFIQHAAGWCFSCQSRKRFYHKLRLYYTSGEIVEHMRLWCRGLKNNN
jgi:glycosyltransferase involved in cell wall biosynthesis